MTYFLRVLRSPAAVDKFLSLYSKNGGFVYPILCSKYTVPCSRTARNYCEKKGESSIVTSKPRGEVSTSVKETVKEATKTVSYLGVILVGVGVTAVMLYAIVSELFSSKSPNSVYTKAVERCCQDERVKNALGEPLQAFGEETRRGRRRHTSHIVYEKDGVEHMRMVFYLKGLREKATVHLEMQENENGKYVYRYLFVQMDISRRVIILEDNRATPQSPSRASPSDDFYSYPSPLTS